MRARDDTQRTTRKGSAMVMALIVVGTVSALSAGYLLLSSAVTNRQDAEVENLRAFYLAEAGLNEAYHGLRIGLAGQIGSQAAPAAFGEGLLWVDATPLEDNRVQLDSTGLCGSGRATLSLVVERVETPLGFFSDEDLVVDEVLLVDGYDSEDGAYHDQVEGGSLRVDPDYPFTNVDEANGILFYQGLFYRYQSFKPGEGGDNWDKYHYDHVLDFTTLVEDPAYSEFDIDADDFTDDDGQEDFEDHEYEGILEYFRRLAENGEGAEGDPAPTVTGLHTAGGGLLGSNGDISFRNLIGEPVEVYGDVIPGAGASVQGGAMISGEFEAREEAVELPEVELPAVDFQLAVQHDSPFPMIISPSTVGYERIDVAADAELIIRGPATVVVGALTLAPGAELTLDTENGAVNLFITSELDLEPGSVVTTAEIPQNLNIQVAAIPTSGGEAPVQLEAQSRFHGLIYAPDTEVRVGSDFEVFGGIVARKLDLGPGARLHFDNAGFDALPTLVSWRIVEIPSGVRALRGNPFAQLGVRRDDLAQLSAAHDLTGITLTVSYINHSGAQLAFNGQEADFDWGAVARVLDSSRSGGAYEGVPGDAGNADVEAVAGDPSSSSSELKDQLLAASPLDRGQLNAAIQRVPPMNASDLKAVLEANVPAHSSTLNILINDGPLDSSALKDVLLLNSPLKNNVLNILASRIPPMNPSDLQAVLDAQ